MKCSRCLQIKAATEFPAPKRGKRSLWCRECTREYHRKWQAGKYAAKMAALGDSRTWCCRGCHEYVAAPRMDSARLDKRGSPKFCSRCAKLTDDELKDRAYKLHREKLKQRYAKDYEYWLKQRFAQFRGELKKAGHSIEFSAFREKIVNAPAKCPLCGIEMLRTGGNQTSSATACIDHDHATGKLRGVICNRCNRLLGLAGDNIALLDAIKAYLQHHRD